MFNYISTRGNAPKLGFADVTMAGLANDGGLYVPEELPKLLIDDIEEIAAMHYKDVAKKIIPHFVGYDLPDEVIANIIDKSYETFEAPDVVEMVQLEENFHVMELFHGKTLAFKDVALEFLGNVFEEILALRKEHVTIVGATSGDTGSAAINAFKGKDNANIFIMHPEGRVSNVQRKQMTTVDDKNVFNIAIKGSFDDCQNLVKDLFAEQDFREEVNMSAVNSINWGRILAQTIYYIYMSSKFYVENHKRVCFTVPTGNFGNVYAGYVAKKMGAPISKLVVATNKNDILHRFFTTGEMRIEKSEETLSPSMDIQIASNFERLLFDIYDRDAEKVSKSMKQLKDEGFFNIGEDSLVKIKDIFQSGSIDDDMTLMMIREVHNQYGYLIDPHTAVGVSVAQSYMEYNPECLMIVLATAHPAKFPDAIKEAIGEYPPIPDRLEKVLDKEEHFVVKDNTISSVREYIEAAI